MWHFKEACAKNLGWGGDLGLGLGAAGAERWKAMGRPPANAGGRVGEEEWGAKKRNGNFN